MSIRFALSRIFLCFILSEISIKKKEEEYKSYFKALIVSHLINSLSRLKVVAGSITSLSTILVYNLNDIYYYADMNEAGAHQEIQHPESKYPESKSILSAGREEEYRKKVAALREGVRQVLCKHEIFLGPGVSNFDLLDILSQVLGNRSTEVAYVEDFNSDWYDVYLQVVKQIAALMSHCEFGVGTEPQDIVKSIEQRLAA